jgi:ferredoxin-fold anticodon binding domain-containing protein
MAPTCFGKAIPSSGSDYVPSELLQRQYGRKQVMEHMVEPMYRRVMQRTVTVHYQLVNIYIFDIMYGTRIKIETPQQAKSTINYQVQVYQTEVMKNKCSHMV